MCEDVYQDTSFTWIIQDVRNDGGKTTHQRWRHGQRLAHREAVSKLEKELKPCRGDTRHNQLLTEDGSRRTSIRKIHHVAIAAARCLSVCPLTTPPNA